jgi:N-acyl-D-amino-acid deacylase
MTRIALVGGTVIDGTGGAARAADVILDGGLITHVGELGNVDAGVEIHDASGQMIAPGWIDVHSHGDDSPLIAADDTSKVLQGVTTEVVGNCGLSLAPRTGPHATALEQYLGRIFAPASWPGESFADLLEATDRRGYVINYAPLVGHGTLRVAVAGFATGQLPGPTESHMLQLLDEAMAAGAIGLSSGLIYPPGSTATTAELVALARIVAERGGIYASHIRYEGLGRMDAVNEAIEIGRAAGVRVEISHHKAKGRKRWGSIAESLAAARAARADGVDVGFDAYPYAASSTMLVACLPPELLVLDDVALRARLAEPSTLPRLRDQLARDDWDNHVDDSGGFDGILVVGTHDGRFEGQTLSEIATERNTDGAEALIHVLLEEHLHAGMVSFSMSEADVEAALADPLTCIGSDSGAVGTAGFVHPRGFGTFPRVLGHYARERGTFTLEQAVHQMTGLPAERFRLPGIGLLQPGYAADVVVFDPTTIADQATYTHPRRPAIGISDVYVSGVAVVEAGAYTGVRAGRRLRLEPPA